MKRSIRADFRQDRQAAKERAAARKAAVSTINEIKDSEDPIKTAFNLLVPANGSCETKAGEIVRAMMRLLYRDWNDGDVFYEGYGIETCGDAVAYLCDKIPGVESKFGDTARRILEGDRYTASLEEIRDDILDYIYKHPELFTPDNDEDYQDWNGKDFIESNEWEPKYEYDCSLPDSIVYHLDKGDISTRDVQGQIESWDDIKDADITVDYGTVYIENIGRETYDVIEGNMYDWLEEYGQDLDDEYGSEDDEYEDEDY